MSIATLFFAGDNFEIILGLLIFQAQQYANKNIENNKSKANYDLAEIHTKNQRYNGNDNRGIKICWRKINPIIN